MKPLICNLKMNFDFQEMKQYKEILEGINCSDLIVCPSSIFLMYMHSSKYQVCAQDVSCFLNGNYTGSISASSLKSIDVHNVLIGHSEIKATFEEKIAKIKQALKQNMHTYIIISETKQDYDYQYSSLKLLSQIRGILSQVLASQYQNITFIYEPSWLVGSKIALNKKDLENIVYYIKLELKRDYNFDFPIFYGGGLTENNILEYSSIKEIDGFLLGTTSLEPHKMSKIVENFKNSTLLDTTRQN